MLQINIKIWILSSIVIHSIFCILELRKRSDLAGFPIVIGEDPKKKGIMYLEIQIKNESNSNTLNLTLTVVYVQNSSAESPFRILIIIKIKDSPLYFLDFDRFKREFLKVKK